MEIDVEPVDLFVPDSSEKHQDLDELVDSIAQRYSITPDNVDENLVPAVVADIVEGCDLDEKYAKISECRKLLNSNPRIREAVLECLKKGSHKDLRRLKVLQKAPKAPSPKAPASKVEPLGLSESAVLKGWEETYVGTAAVALWDHVETWFQEVPQLDTDRSFYAKYSAIIQSSGMGKSRVVDEMSKLHFVIPVILRKPQSSGFPPSDISAYAYLVASESQRDAFIRSCAFLHALFEQTTGVVEGMDGSSAAEQFRNFMKDGTLEHSHGAWRRNFYEAVETDARQYYKSYSEYLPDESSSTDKMDQRLRADGSLLREAFKKLCFALEVQSKGGIESARRKGPDSKRKRPNSKHECPKRPSVVLAFDEVHTLTDEKWSNFGELRRALRGLLDDPLFTLFLSTSGTLFSTSCPPERDRSSRMVKHGDVMLPFYELGFDQLARKVNFSKKKKLTMSQITSEEYLTSYGRPLWHPYYESAERRRIIGLAASKLLEGAEYKGRDSKLSDKEKLACLAQRIPIEFLSACYSSQITDEEKAQVHSHMRVILKIDRSLETMVTASPSEPILSEAAYFVMTTQPTEEFNPPQVLQEILTGFAVHKGELGELIVALLLIMARDEAVGPAGTHGPPLSGRRWSSVTKLLASLFCTPTTISDDHVNVPASYGWRFTKDGTKQYESPFAEELKQSKVYFTHFIKVHEHAIVQVEYLMHLMVRGAAILCGNNQPGMGGIIPFLLRGEEIRKDNIGVIMFQVKNDAHYTHKPKASEVCKMNPRDRRIISPSTDVPVIRLFFALAAKTPTLKAVEHDPLYTVLEDYTAYDFWVSGLSPEILLPVKGRDTTWKSILHEASRWQKIYENKLQRLSDLRKSMNPGAATDDAFWENWSDEVPIL